MTTGHSPKFDRKVTLQRLAMLWENVWHRLYWPLLAIGLATIVLSSGILQTFGPNVRIGILVVLALAFLVSLRDLLKLALPSELSAMRRMEEEAGLVHRKVSSTTETIVSELDSPETRELWTEHKRRQLAGLEQVPVSPPRSSWRDFDPRAFRVPVLLAALAALLLGPGDIAANLKQAATLTPPVAPVTLAIDAWLKPPAYTGKAPLLLTSPAMQQKLAEGQEILVPENAVLTIRATGAAKPRLEFYGLGTEPTDANRLKDVAAKTETKETTFTAEAKLTRPLSVRLYDGTTQIASWPISLVPDQPPTVKSPKPSSVEIGGALTMPWEVGDDYGVKSLKSTIELADQQDDGIGFSGNGPFLFDAPEFPMVLKKSNAKQEAGKTTLDMTAHPWAGLNVEMTLTVTDAAGQTAATAPIALKLPERPFTRPLAKALIEQRKTLILDPERAPDVATLFFTLLKYPAGLIDRSAHHIRLASIASHLENANGNDDVKTSIGDLWQLAVEIEDGSLSDAKAELRELKKQLEEALRNGASEQEIAKLMDKMRAAMDRYLQSMQQERKKQNQQSGNQRNNNQQSREVSKEDLQKMLDMIEKLSKNGSKDMAQNLLDELDRMLQNLQPGDNQQAGEQGDQLGEMLDQLSDLMNQQQRLMDETQRSQNGEQPGDQPGNQQGEGQQGQNGNTPGGLAGKQGALKDLLDRLAKELGGNSPGALGDAGREMQGAQGSLQQGDRDGALSQQQSALDQLRKGAQELGRQMRERGQGQARNRGRDGGSWWRR